MVIVETENLVRDGLAQGVLRGWYSRSKNVSAFSVMKNRLCLGGESGPQGGGAYQSWNLDAQGNWSSYISNGSTQTRTANQQNELTSVSGLLTPAYDANGNMTTDQNGDTLIYDAWNRLVELKNASGQVIAEYTYNAQGYAVTATYPQGTSQLPPGTTNYLYYTSSWQLIEVRTGGTAAADVTVQMVWSAAYINAPVVQDTYSAGVIQPNSRLYFIQDANWNTTAVVGYDATTNSWNVVQRYVYSPYGTITILNPDFTTAPAGTVPMVNNLYQGMANDPVTGLYYERARWYSPSLGTWISQDPAHYIDGANTYQFVMSDPVGRADPTGLLSYPNNFRSGMGWFYVHLDNAGPPAPSADGFSTDVDVTFKASPAAKKLCLKTIKFIQLVHAEHGLGAFRQWHADGGPWYEGMSPWFRNQKPSSVLATAWDQPTALEYLVVPYFNKRAYTGLSNVREQQWKTYAVGILPGGKELSFGYAEWSITYFHAAEKVLRWVYGGSPVLSPRFAPASADGLHLEPRPGGIHS